MPRNELCRERRSSCLYRCDISLGCCCRSTDRLLDHNAALAAWRRRSHVLASTQILSSHPFHRVHRGLLLVVAAFLEIPASTQRLQRAYRANAQQLGPQDPFQPSPSRLILEMAPVPVPYSLDLRHSCSIGRSSHLL